MIRATSVLLLGAIACSRQQPRADSVASGASAAAVAATPIPADTGRIADSPATVSKAAAPPAGDVIVGRVGEHGADPLTFIAITPAGGAQTRISGAQLEALAATKGAEVWARGRRAGNAFVVDTFEVRRANDQAVEDGIVSVSGGTVTVRTARGTLRYPDAPAALRDAAGARVWITPPVSGQAPSFGIIRTARK